MLLYLNYLLWTFFSWYIFFCPCHLSTSSLWLQFHVFDQLVIWCGQC